jgi:endonuclease-3 related protein
MASTEETLLSIHDLLLAAYGPQGWWPAETPFEVCVGAILTQNTNWANVEKAIVALKGEGLLSPRALADVSLERLAQLIRSAGYFNLKSGRLKEFVRFLLERYRGSLEEMFARDWRELRGELLAVKGIGPETADAILLYGGGQPTFVVDTYTRRLVGRVGVLPEGRGYDGIRQLFMDHLPADAGLYNEYHALIVRHAKERCRKVLLARLCAGCSLMLNGRCLHPVSSLLLGQVEGAVRFAEE